jgi:hypothetical protein
MSGIVEVKYWGMIISKKVNYFEKVIYFEVYKLEKNKFVKEK